MRGNSKRKKRKLLKTENRAEGTAYKTQGGIKKWQKLMLVKSKVMKK